MRASFFALLTLLAAVACDPVGWFGEDECPKVGEKTCDGYVVYLCENSGGHADNELSREADCWDLGMSCVEWKESDGDSDAACLLTGEACSEIGSLRCVSTYLARCNPEGQIVIRDEFNDCSYTGQYCQATDGKHDVCVYKQGSCEVEGSRACTTATPGPDDDHPAITVCEDGYWTGRYDCPSDRPACGTVPDGGIGCVEEGE